jgi:hypothetical protein
MSTLSILGFISFCFCLAFTYHAAMKEPSVGQTPRSAIFETWINILIGFAVNFLANIWIMPMVGAHFGNLENFAMGWIYTSISMIRQYSIRRWFNAKIHEAAMRLARENPDA